MIENNEVNRAKMIAVAERLLGSATSADDAIQAEFGDDDMTIADIPQELLVELDDQVTECGQCGFWAEAGAVDDNETCDDCRDDEDES